MPKISFTVADDGGITAKLGSSISRLSIENIMDVYSHTILREGVLTRHKIKFADGGTLDFGYRHDGSIERYEAHKVGVSLTDDENGMIVINISKQKLLDPKSNAN